MTGRPSRETVMTALLNALTTSVQTNFTANTNVNSVTLDRPSTMAGLFVGLPVFGAGVPRGAVIQTLSPLTISLPATANGGSVALTTGFLTFSRRFQFWNQVSAQPALFLRDGDEDQQYLNIILSRQTMKAEVWIYSKAGENPDIAPVTALNNLLDAVDAAFSPDDPQTGRFTLGGLVEWCRREGKVLKDPGDASGQAIAVADIEITVP
jgi:hypothetical protein